MKNTYHFSIIVVIVAIMFTLSTNANAAKGGGFIFQSDHSVSSDVSGKTYDYVVKLVREYGKYPLNLAEMDEEI